MRDSLFPLFSFIHNIDSAFAVVFIVLMCVLVIGYYEKRQALGLFSSVALTFGTTHILKNLFAIPRPDAMTLVADGYRFPSFHASITAAIVTSLWWYAMSTSQSKTKKVIATALAILVISVVSISRVVLNVHEPIDVIVGTALGISIALLVQWLLLKYNR